MTGPQIAWYGDDFTGSAAVLEVLAAAGLRAVLFLDPPGPETPIDGLDAVGIAGMSRTWSPAQMRDGLPPVFRALAATGAAVLHYKICSTLDSSPAVGSIGTAIDIAAATVPYDWMPLYPASPGVGRYQAFGTLFARSGGAIHRLDRHPVMRCHPVTPMDEADVRLHVGRQTGAGIGLIDLLDLPEADAALDRLLAVGTRVVALDTVTPDDLAHVGRLIATRAGRGRLIAFGSQGVEEALVAHWRTSGRIGAAAAGVIPPAACLLGLSGSVSAITERQLAQAAEAGFHLIRLDAAAVLADADSAVAGAAIAALSALRAGRPALVATALGPGDALHRPGRAAAGTGEQIGAALGRVAARVQAALPLDRIVVAGGDTSGSVCRALGIGALDYRGRLAPGAGLFGALTAGGRPMGFDIALKGGQMGPPDYFPLMRDGWASSAAS